MDEVKYLSLSRGGRIKCIRKVSSLDCKPGEFFRVASIQVKTVRGRKSGKVILKKVQGGRLTKWSVYVPYRYFRVDYSGEGEYFELANQPRASRPEPEPETVGAIDRMMDLAERMERQGGSQPEHAIRPEDDDDPF